MRTTTARAGMMALALAAPTIAQEDPEKFRVDLSEQQVEPSRLPSGLQERLDLRSDGPLGRPWYQNVDLWGHLAAHYLDTGKEGTQPEGSFMVREANLFLELQVWEGVSAMIETRYARAGLVDDAMVRTEEVFIHFRDVLESHPGLLNFKVGSVDIPFGEEYLRQDAIDSPTINYPAALPYGVDEGIVGYGKLGGIDWFASVMDGTGDRSSEDSSEKAVSLKLGGKPTDSWYVSGSVMRTGNTGKSANCFSGFYLSPVGSTPGVPSSAGTSASSTISAVLYELDTEFRSDDLGAVRALFGQAHVDDPTPGFDRDLTWFMVEPTLQLTDKLYATARYSEFGTYDSNEGYAMNGRMTAAGVAAFGWDTRRLQRFGLTLGYREHQNLVFKTEVGRDRFWLIDASPLTPAQNRRWFFGFEVVVGF